MLAGEDLGTDKENSSVGAAKPQASGLAHRGLGHIMDQPAPTTAPAPQKLSLLQRLLIGR